MSAAELTGQTQVPAVFLRFIGVMEILGGLGLILPGMLRIRTELTSLAAAGPGHNHDRRRGCDHPDDGLCNGCTAVCNWRLHCLWLTGVGEWRRWARRTQRHAGRVCILDIEPFNVLTGAYPWAFGRSINDP
ncbi:MAG: DoxX family protein [Acidobacteriota bacterium]|nr:DoxX family protein [Acidobacteriota bacterium]